MNRSNGTCPNIIHYGQARHSWDRKRFTKVISRKSVKSMTVSGSISSVEMRCRGTGKVTGEDLDVQNVQVCDLREGKCVRWQEYLDTWQLAREINPT